MTGDKKVPIKLKEKVYKTVINSTMTYGADCYAVIKKDENRLHAAEMKMLRLCLHCVGPKPGKDHVRNQVIQENAKVCQMSTFLRQKRLNWYRHTRRREEDNLSRKRWAWLYLPGEERKGGLDGDGLTTPGRIWKYELTADMTENRHYWENDEEDWPTKMWRWSLKVRIA